MVSLPQLTRLDFLLQGTTDLSVDSRLVDEKYWFEDDKNYKGHGR